MVYSKRNAFYFIMLYYNIKDRFDGMSSKTATVSIRKMMSDMKVGVLYKFNWHLSNTLCKHILKPNSECENR